MILLIIFMTIFIYFIWYHYDLHYKNSKIELIVDKIKNNYDFSILSNISKLIDTDIQETLNNIENQQLKDICKYATKGGKRIRPIIAYSIFFTNNNKHLHPETRKMLSGIELLHNASLVIDDIMDNDTVRRNNLSVYAKYGQNTAQLCSAQLLALYINIIMSANTAIMADSFIEHNDKIILLQHLNKIVSENTNLLIEGQYLDLSHNNILLKDTYIEILRKKTSSIFSMIFCSAYILSGKNVNNLNNVNRMGILFGVMFQIYDDFTDYYSDKINNKFNIIEKHNIDNSFNMYVTNRNEFINLANNLEIYNDVINNIVAYMNTVVEALYTEISEN